MSIDDIYRQRCETRSDIYEHLPFMHDLVAEQSAQVVVEFGVRSGNSTVALLAAVEASAGHLWSVDIDGPPDLPAHPQWTFIQANDLDLADELPEQIDVLFIDTSHHYDHTLAELRLYGQRAATILMHDTELCRPYLVPVADPDYPVRAAIETWCAETGRTWTNRPHCWGLGIIHPEGA